MELIDTKLVKGLRVWVKKTLAPETYRSVPEIQDRLKSLLNVDLPQLSTFLLLKKNLLPLVKEKEMRSVVDDLRDKVNQELKAAREVIEDAKGKIDWQILATTPGTFEALHRPDVIDFYAKKGNFLQAMSEIADEAIGKADDILSGRLLRAISNWLARYGAKEEGFQTEEIVTQFTLGDMKVLLSESRPENARDVRSVKDYIRPFQAAKERLERKGLGRLWYGTTFLGCKTCGGDNPYGKQFGVGGHYLIGRDEVVIFSDPSSSITSLLVHELGHRYYYHFMNGAQRARFDSYFKEVDPSSEYGGSSPDEDFAEVFLAYVMGKDLNRDQIERFRAFLAGEDSRTLRAAGFEEYLSPEVVRYLIDRYALRTHGSLRWKYGPLSSRVWGVYNGNSKTLVVNEAKTKNLFFQQVQTILHEIQHWNQHQKWLSENSGVKENPFGGPSYMNSYTKLQDLHGYWNNPMEVDARDFSKKHQDEAIRGISKDIYGAKSKGTWEEVLLELVDISEDTNGILTRGAIGQALRDYEMNNVENLAKAIQELKDLGVKVL